MAHLYSAPHPFTNDMRIVHIRVSWYTASKPCDTDWDSRAANSWLLNIFRLQAETGIITVKLIILNATKVMTYIYIYDLKVWPK